MCSKCTTQEPGTIVRLYNSVVGHLGDVVTHDDLYSASWPVTEFADGGERSKI